MMAEQKFFDEELRQNYIEIRHFLKSFIRDTNCDELLRCLFEELVENCPYSEDKPEKKE
ncbi:hypothetical protein KJ966_07245 [bacterium]|nr:hypothetical protein [bacterium]